MKRFYKIIAALLILAIFSTVVLAGPVITGTQVDRFEFWMEGLDYHATIYRPLTISRHGTLIIFGNLYIDDFADLRIDGNIFVAGNIIGDISLAYGRNTWQLHPVWQWIARWLLGGQIWVLFSWFVTLLGWIVTRRPPMAQVHQR